MVYSCWKLRQLQYEKYQWELRRELALMKQQRDFFRGENENSCSQLKMGGTCGAQPDWKIHDTSDIDGVYVEVKTHKVLNINIPICSICLNGLCHGIQTLKCGHVFHSQCQKFVDRDRGIGGGKCPNCRIYFSEEEIKDIFYKIDIYEANSHNSDENYYKKNEDCYDRLIDKKVLHTLRESYDKLDQNHKDLDKQNTEIKNDMNHLIENLQKVEEKNQQLRIKFEKLEEENLDLEGRIVRFKAQRKNLVRENDRLSNRCQMGKKNRLRLEAKLEILKKENLLQNNKEVCESSTGLDYHEKSLKRKQLEKITKRIKKVNKLSERAQKSQKSCSEGSFRELVRRKRQKNWNIIDKYS